MKRAKIDWAVVTFWTGYALLLACVIALAPFYMYAIWAYFDWAFALLRVR